MAIPYRLVPKPWYKKINVDYVGNKARNYYLLRRGVQGKNPNDPVGGVSVKLLYSDAEHVKNGYSCWLLGRMKINDMIIDPENNEDWQRCGKFVCGWGLNYKELGGAAVFFKLSLLHNESVPYDDETARKKEPGMMQLGSSNKKLWNERLKEKFVGRSRVEHKPSISNFWHFEVRFYDEKDTPIEENKIINSIMRSFMKSIADLNEPVNYSYLPKREYIGKPCFFDKVVVTGE